MKKLFFSTSIFLASVSVSSQTPGAKILQLISTQKYEQAFQYGKQQIKDLNQKSARNYGMEFLTWTALSLCQDPTGKKGCELTEKYLAKNKKKLTSAGSYTLFSSTHRNVCIHNGRDFSGLASIPSFSTATVHESEREAGYITDFKTYMYLKQAVNPQLYFDNAFELVLQRSKVQATKEISIKRGKKQQLISVLKDSFNIGGYLSKVYPRKKYLVGTSFIVISKKVGDDTLRTTLSLLEKTLNFYKKQLNLKVPSEHITVFLSTNSYDVNKDISSLYGIDVGSDVLGFSDVSTNSVVAWLPDFDKIGTIKHELIHLLLRKQFMFAPEWFEEGLATLYEESRFDSTDLTGLGNWRGNLLASLFKLDHNIPRMILSNLLNNDTSTFNYLRISSMDGILSEARSRARQKMLFSNMHYNESEARKLSEKFVVRYTEIAEDAMSRYLMLYLQNIGKLGEFVDLMRKNEEDALETFELMDLREILMRASGQTSYGNFEASFLSWLESAPRDGRIK